MIKKWLKHSHHSQLFLSLFRGFDTTVGKHLYKIYFIYNTHEKLRTKDFGFGRSLRWWTRSHHVHQHMVDIVDPIANLSHQNLLAVLVTGVALVETMVATIILRASHSGCGYGGHYQVQLRPETIENGYVGGDHHQVQHRTAKGLGAGGCDQQPFYPTLNSTEGMLVLAIIIDHVSAIHELMDWAFWRTPRPSV